MRHIQLGGTGLPVSRLCLGTMTFAGQCDEARSRAILDTAAAGGIDFIDTANVYPMGGGPSSAGRTEEIVGTWLKGKRHQFILATKCAGQFGNKPWERGMSRKHVLDPIDGSLRRLGADYVDLYQLHNFDPRTPIDEALQALDTVVRLGQSALCWRVELARCARRRRAWPRGAEKFLPDRFSPAVLQPADSRIRTGFAATERTASRGALDVGRQPRAERYHYPIRCRRPR
jgi:aryl-alcohol dehydrogenase-like predicted oxidoreductase